MKDRARRGSSLIFLGFSIIAFVVTYGIMFTLVPIVLGVFFSLDTGTLDADWQATRDESEDVIRWLVPLVPTMGIFILVVKVLMTASVRGRD